MIRRLEDLRVELEHGMTVSRLIGMDDRQWRYVITDTSETVRGNIFKRAVEKGWLSGLATDIAGEPMQWAPVPGALTA